jgi:hypothetical protein
VQQFFPSQHFQLRRVGLEHVELEAAAARLAHHALQDVRLAAAPAFHGDTVTALEVRREPELVFLRDRRIKHQLALFLGGGDQALAAIGARIRSDGGDSGRGLDREARGRNRQAEQNQEAKRHGGG